LAFVVTLGVTGKAGAGGPDAASAGASARWKEGAAAFSAGKYEAARVAFLQAYSILPNPALLQNLGEAELRTAHYVEAATHLSEYLDRAVGKPDDQARARSSLAAALQHVARLVVESNVPAPQVSVDGQPTSDTPTESRPLLLRPGLHTVAVSKPGYESMQKDLELEEGMVTRTKCELVALSLHDDLRPKRIDELSKKRDEAASEKPPASNAGIETRTIAILVAGGLTVVAVGMGTYFELSRAADERRAQELRALLAMSTNTTQGGACVRPTSIVAAWCSELDERVNARATVAKSETIAFAAAGVLGAATIATVLFWPRKHEPYGIQAIPRVSWGGGSLVVVAQF